MTELPATTDEAPSPRHRSAPRVEVLGVRVSALDLPTAVSTLCDWAEAGVRDYVCVTGVHGVMESQRDRELLEIHNRAGMVTPDGMPLVWSCWYAGQGSVGRVYGPDLLLEVCATSVERGLGHFFYGGAPGVAVELASSLEQRYPGLRVVGTFSPPYRPLRPEEDEAICRDIERAHPDFVWVGLSTPKQERWMADHVDRVPGILLGVGAAFDFHSGGKPQAPRWMQRNGLEWLFRAISEPLRLGPRYLRNNPEFMLRWLIRRPRPCKERAAIRRGSQT